MPMKTRSRLGRDPGQVASSSNLAAASSSSSGNPAAALSSPSDSLRVLSSPLDYVVDFFRSRPPELTRAKDGGYTESVGTRAPADFDMHLRDDLRLHHVVKLPSIPQDLIRIAQEVLDAYPGHLPPIPPGSGVPFPTPAVRQSGLFHSPLKTMRRESDVETFYGSTTARYCEVVASQLAFPGRRWSSGCLRFSTFKMTRQKGGSAQKAITDGYLNMVKVDLEGNALGLTETQQGVVNHFPVLAVFEFKNLNFGLSEETLGKVVNNFLAPWFPWETCEHGQKCATTHDIGVTGFRMGRDAKVHPCASVRAARASQAQHPYGPMPEKPWLSSVLAGESQIARYMLQQAWAEGVQHDATFIIIQAGNFEVICIRNRANQTLYISDVIKVDNCDYRQLHTGLYIAAIRDAEDRVSLLKSPGEAWNVKFGLDGTKKVVNLKRKSKKAVAGILWQQACTREWLKISPDPFDLNHFPFIKDTEYQRVRYREASMALSTAVSDTDTLFKLLAQDSFYAHHICRAAVKLPGTVFGKANKDAKAIVVIKNASRPEEIARLENEYKVYLDLQRAGVTMIPQVAGFFRYMKEGFPTKCFAVLVLEDVGQSLEQILEQETDGQPFVTRKQLNLFITALNQIHSANYLHKNLTPKSLMFKRGRNSDEIAILGFADAVHLTPPAGAVGGPDETIVPASTWTDQTPCEMQEDVAALLNLLPNPLRRKADAAPTASPSPAQKLPRIQPASTR